MTIRFRIRSRRGEPMRIDFADVNGSSYLRRDIRTMSMWDVACFFLVLFLVLNGGVILFMLGRIMDADLHTETWQYTLLIIWGLGLCVVAAVVFDAIGNRSVMSAEWRSAPIHGVWRTESPTSRSSAEHPPGRIATLSCVSERPPARALAQEGDGDGCSGAEWAALARNTRKPAASISNRADVLPTKKRRAS